MAEVLVLQLDPTLPMASWMVADTAGVRVGPVERGRLASAVSRLGQRRLIVLVPGTDVLLTRASVPVRSAAKLLQIVPYALEEQLAEDVERLHFAVGKVDADGQVPVAVIARERMDAWLAVLGEAGLRPYAVYAESSVAPASPNAWSLLVMGERIIAASPDGRASTFDGLSPEEVVELLEASRPGRDEVEQAAGGLPLIVYLTEAEHDRLAARLDRLRLRAASLELKLLPEGPLPQLAVRAAATPGVSLLQGDYAPQSSARTIWRPWRIAAALALGLLGLHLVGQSIDLWSLSARERALDQQIASVYRSALPGAERIVNPRFQMQQALTALGGAGGAQEGFLRNLATLGKAIAATPNTRLDNLSFRNDVMDLRLRAPNVEALDSIRRAVSDEGLLRAEIQSATPEGEVVEGRIQLRGSGQ